MKKTSLGACKDTKGFLRRAETLLEICALTAIYYLTWKVGYDSFCFPHLGKITVLGVYAVLLYIFFRLSDSTLFGQLRQTDLIIGQVIDLFLVNFVTYFQLCLIERTVLSAVPMLILFGVEVVVAAGLISLYTALHRKLYRPHSMLLVYGNEHSLRLKTKMDSRKDKYNISGLICADEGYDKIVREIPEYDAVILNDVPTAIRDDILKFCYSHSIRTYVAPTLSDVMLRSAQNVTLFDTPLMLVKGTGLTLAQRAVKRGMDILISSLALLVLAIPMALVAIAIKAEDGGPVLFKQKRMTLGGREFEILKFRSMIVNAEKYTGAVLAADNDSRITKVGKIIRATRLDELPQIFNVLKGDMSIVGPRPERKVIAEEYYKDTPEFAYRLKVRGGLTGYAQIYGKYNTDPYDKLRLDMMYIENYSLLLDIKLIVLTMRIIFDKESTQGLEVSAENQKPTQQISDDLADGED